TSVEFQYSPANAGTWTTIASDPVAPYSASFDTLQVPDGIGVYDVRAVATDSAGEQTAALARDRAIANDATYVSLVDPGAILDDRVSLRAVVPPGQFDPTHGTFEISRSGAEQWTPIGTVPAGFDDLTGTTA